MFVDECLPFVNRSAYCYLSLRPAHHTCSTVQSAGSARLKSAAKPGAMRPIGALVTGFGTACGFALAIVLLAGIRERIDESQIPKPFRGMPIVLLSAGLMAMAFFGFKGLL